MKELLGAESVGDLDAVEADVEVDAPLVAAHCLLDDLAKIKKREEKRGKALVDRIKSSLRSTVYAM